MEIPLEGSLSAAPSQHNRCYLGKWKWSLQQQCPGQLFTCIYSPISARPGAGPVFPCNPLCTWTQNVLTQYCPLSFRHQLKRCKDVPIFIFWPCLTLFASLNQKGQDPLLYHDVSKTKKEKKRLSNAFSRCKTRVSESDVLLFKQQKHCPSGLMLSRVTMNPLGVHSFSSQMRGKLLHQGQLLLYCAELLACHCSLPYFQKKHPRHTWSVSTGAVAQSTLTAEQTPRSEAIMAPWGCL